MLGIAMSIYLLVLSREDENVVYRVSTGILFLYSLQRASKFRLSVFWEFKGFRLVPLGLHP